jgi:hypothetical protein
MRAPAPTMRTPAPSTATEAKRVAGVPQNGITAPVDVPGAAALPFAAPGIGAAIGEGMAQLGGQLEQGQIQRTEEAARAKDLAARRQYEVDASAAGVATAQATLDVSQQIDAIRQEAAPGAAGHVEAVTKAVDDRFGEVLKGISNPVLRSQYADDLARAKARLVGEESTWASGQKVAYQVTNVQKTAQLLGNNVLERPDQATFDDSLKTLATTIGNQGLPADKTEQLFREQAQELAISRAQGLTISDPKAALQLLGGDELTPYLPADKRTQLIHQAETAIRVQDADQRRQVTQAAAQVRVDAQTLNDKISQGVLVSDDDVAGLVSRGQALVAVDPGLKNTIETLQYNQGKLKYSRLTDHWTTNDWNAHINPLAAKVAKGQASEDEQRELKILQELRPGKEQRFHNDPDGYSAASGITPPQVDIANPDDPNIPARKSWAKAYAGTAGLLEPPYLNKDQLNLYRQRASQGPVGQLEVAEELRGTWGMDAAPSIVRQIGGEAKNDMMVMLGLNAGVAQIYRQGADALSKKAVQLNDDQARAIAAPLLRSIPDDMRPAVFDAARNIAAGWMQRQGFTSIPSNFADVFAGALQWAGGRGGDVKNFNSPGGFAELNGRYAWLPSDMNSNQFLHRVARAQPQDWVKAAVDSAGNPVKSVPHHLGPDGKPKPYTKGEALRFNRGTLETVAPGIYHLIDPLGGTVVDEKGRPWTFDVRRLGR